MTERRTATTTDPAMREPEPPPAPEARPTAERPPGTRELRDAQAAPRQMDRRPAIQAEDQASSDIDAPLFARADAEQLRERWIAIQTEFVDSPRDAVERADGLVAEVLRRLTESFAQERDQLEAAWSHDDGERGQASTEDLRQAIRRYRSFFNRLLSV